MLFDLGSPQVGGGVTGHGYDEVYCLADELRGGAVGDPGDYVVAVVEGDEDPSGAALGDAQGHGGGNLPQKGVGNDDADGADYDVSPAAGHGGGIFACGGLVGSGPEHRGGGGGVGADGEDPGLGELGPQSGDELLSHAAALGVHNKYCHMSLTPSRSQGRK